MKNRPVFTTLLLFMATCFYGQGIEFSSGDFDYEVLDFDESIVELKALDGTLKGDVIIPDSVTYNGITYTVIGIGDVGQNPDVLSISIPKSVTSISSLSGLTGLLNVYVDSDNKYYKSIDGVLVQISNMRLSDYPRGRRGECIIPEGVRQIDTYFFDGITKLFIPSTVNSISSYIAEYVAEFVVDPENEYFCSINRALYSKDGKTLIAYPATTSTIVNIPSTVDSIGTYAFCGHSVSVILNRPTPPTIGKYSYNSTNSYITSLFVKSDNLSAYQSNERTSAYTILSYDFEVDNMLFSILPDNSVELTGCYQQSPRVNIPETVFDNSGNPHTVTSVGRRCFYDNYDLQEVTFPETLKNIGDSAFFSTDITSVTFPMSLKTIGKNAFFYCWNLQNVYSNCAPIDISNGCFYNYRNLFVPCEFYDEYNTAIGWQYFNIIANDLTDNGFVFRKLSENTVSVVKYIGNEKDIIIPNVVSIGGETYKVTEIESQAFYYKGIESLTLPQYLTTIGYYAFGENYSLKEVVLPPCLETVGEYAFSSCGLTSIDIPQSVVSIGDYAFCWNSISSIHVKNCNPFEIGYNAFGYTYSVKIFVTPASLVDAFKTAENWNNYTYIYGVDDVIDGLGIKVLSDTEAAVVCCSKSFDEQTNVRSVIIPEKVTIDDREYQVTTITDSAFYQSNANFFTIPATIDSIGLRAFCIYNSLIMVFEGETPAHINGETFYQWYSKVILVPPTVVDIYKETLGWQKVSNYIKANGTMIDGIIYKPLDDNRAVVDLAVAIPSSGILFLPKEVIIDDKNYQVAVIGQDAFNSHLPQYLVLPETIDSIYNPNDLGSTFTYLQATVPPKVANSHTNRVYYVPSASKSIYDADPRWHYAYDSDKYIIGVDGMVDSLIYKTVDGNATLMGWLKTVNYGDTIIVPATITANNSQNIPVTGLGDEVFYSRYGISKLILPATIDYVGQNALPQNVNTVTLDAMAPPTILAQSYISSYATLWVKGQSVQAYLDAEVWNKFNICSEDKDAPLFRIKALDDKNVEITGVLADDMSSIVIPDSVLMNGKMMCVKSVGDGAFNKVYRIRSLVVPASIENFGNKVFSPNRSDFDKIQVRAGNRHYMSRDNKMLLSKDGKTLVCVANYGINLERNYYYENGRQKYRLENTLDSVETLVPGAFDGYYPSYCYSYHNNNYLPNCIPLPASLKSISGEDLMYVRDLRNITVDTLSQTLCDIDGVLFSKDTTSIIRYPDYRYSDYELPYKVRRIEKLAFYNSSFESLTLSDSLKFIADSAFYQSNNYYNSIQLLNLVNEEMAQATNLSFTNDMYQNTVLYVPMGTQNDYLTTNPWSKFRNINSAKLAEEDFALLKSFYEEMGNGEGWYNKWTFGVTADETRIIRGIRMIDEHVYSIDLSNNGLKGGLSDKLFRLPALEILNLSNNQLACPIDSVLDEDNIDNTVLRELKIANNQLTGNIGSVTNTLKNLATLDVSNNRLEEVTPMLSPTVTSICLGQQTIDKIVDLPLSNLSSDYLSNQVPNILLYNHAQQSYSTDIRLLCSTKDNAWSTKMVSQNGKVTLTSASTDNAYQGQSGDILNAALLNHYGSREGSTFQIQLSFDLGDSNFDGSVNILDLQTNILYIMEKYDVLPYNFTAANLWSDELINIQDIICLVNLLLNSEQEGEENANSRRDALNTEEASDASIYVQDGKLILNTCQPVAAIDLRLSGANSINLAKDLQRMGMTFVTKKQFDGLHIIAYSMNGACIPSGTSLIGTIDSDAAVVNHVMLSDAEANALSVSLTGMTTGIEDIGVSTNGGQPVYDLQGRRVNCTSHKGLYIKNGHIMIK